MKWRKHPDVDLSGVAVLTDADPESRSIAIYADGTVKVDGEAVDAVRAAQIIVDMRDVVGPSIFDMIQDAFQE